MLMPRMLGYRLVATILVGALGLAQPHLAGAAVPRGATALPRGFTDPSYKYSIRYPGDWQSSTKVPSNYIGVPELMLLAATVNLFIAPDKNAGVYGIAGPGAYKAKEIKDAERAVLSQGTAIQGTIHYRQLKIDGVAFAVAEADVKLHDTPAHQLILATVQHRVTYFFTSNVVQNGPNAATEASQVVAMLATIRLR